MEKVFFLHPKACVISSLSALLKIIWTVHKTQILAIIKDMHAKITNVDQAWRKDGEQNYFIWHIKFMPNFMLNNWKLMTK